jgi:molybdopterin adenylyltransferase
MGSEDHREQAAEAFKSVPCAIITCSDTRTAENDTSGQTIRQYLAEAGHEVVAYNIIKDEAAAIEALLEELVQPESKARVILINGGTGIAPRDRTYDVVARKLEKTLPGFGELFRMLSYEEVGAAAMLSRAIAGVYRGKVIVSMPGSRNAVNLAMQKLIMPELQHLAWEAIR